MRVAFICAWILLPIDGFPLGISLAREFGARPTNFALGALLSVIVLDTVRRFTKIYLAPSTIVRICLVSLVVALNGYVVAFLRTHSIVGRPPFLHWLLQVLMVIWMILSIAVWRRMFAGISNNKLRNYSVFAVLVNTVFFLDDVLHILGIKVSEVLSIIQDFSGGHKDPYRPAGLCSEPSLWSSWILVIWPLLLLYDGNKNGRNSLGRNVVLAVAFLAVTTGYFSGSRTFKVVFPMQVLFLLVARIMSGRRTARLLGKGILLVCLVSVLFVASTRTTVFDMERSMSSLTRLGTAAVAGMVWADHFFLGVGVGQFSHFFRRYVPSGFLGNSEMMHYATGDLEHRVPTYNMPIRLGAEGGILWFLLGVGSLLYIVLRAFRMMPFNGTYSLCFISLLGGISFWFQQDQFGYQPAIATIGLWLTLFDRGNRGRHCNHQVTAILPRRRAFRQP